MNPLTKIFGTANERALKKLHPIVDEINGEFEKLKELSDAELKGKTEEFRERLKSGESVDDLMVETFAVVKEACRRLLGKKWEVTGHEWEWGMVPFDVQLMGAIVLHQGKIAEMATGEGKTLVATMPLYLNSLTGNNVNLITVNDYLARRDAQWMGGVYDFLGVSVGCIQAGMNPEERTKEYACDITYGTNNEFGFDYLRDNMAWRAEDRVQRGHHYAIVDEVDSVLIDEARTPLIISGAVEHSVNREYDRLKPRVDRIVGRQVSLVNRLVAEAEKLLNEGKEKEAGIRLLKAKRGAPKNKRLMKLEKEKGVKKLTEETEAEFLREKKLHDLDEELYYTMEEKSNIVNISDMGRETLAPEDKDFFTPPDLSLEFKKIDDDTGKSQREKFVAKQAVERNYAEKSERVHIINQLLRAYSLFEKDVEYVVQDGKVMIVDEFTGRLMPGRRYSDGLHQAIEAKEGVKVEAETQTLATITLQNYFRMYEKLAGMTGTAETEAHEFWDIYKLEVAVVPTNRPVRRIEYPDVIYKTRREKYNAVINEIEEMHKAGRPVLVGTVSVEASETLSRMLNRKGIPHSVLNARYHQKEAEIVAQAGQPGVVTIATNMAGRGTDIKLGEGVVKCEKCCIICNDDCSQCYKEKKMTECLGNPPCGLHILGTERHEARRIDRQLRGRCARQGDPGSARFYLSLEDDLMRLFGSDRIAAVMDRFGVPDNEPIQHNLVTRAIEGAQKRVERYNFDIRKHLLEYDNVMNKQREVIYALRNYILDKKDLRDKVKEIISDVVDEIIDTHIDPKLSQEEWDIEGLRGELQTIFFINFEINPEDLQNIKDGELSDKLHEAVSSLYKHREEEIGEDMIRDLERQVMLSVIDRKWREHLYELDALKEGIGLRGYGQRDPLVEYKRESFALFEELLSDIDREVARHLFGLRFTKPGEERKEEPLRAYKPGVEAVRPQEQPEEAVPAGVPAGVPSGAPQMQPGMQQEARRIETYRRKGQKVGRNDPCPCGSGKKYKKCCGRFEK
jgi:preprotein translocase subunit SecA